MYGTHLGMSKGGRPDLFKFKPEKSDGEHEKAESWGDSLAPLDLALASIAVALTTRS